MSSSSRIFDPRQFISHCHKYGFLLRSGDPPKYGLPALRVCDRIVAECLRFSDASTSSANSSANNDRRFFLRGVNAASPSASKKAAKAHLDHAIHFLETSPESPLRSDFFQNVPFSVVQGIRAKNDNNDDENLEAPIISTLGSFPHLSIIQYFPPDVSGHQIATYRRKRLRFYRSFAEFPGAFSICRDGIFFHPLAKGDVTTTEKRVDGNLDECEDSDAEGNARDTWPDLLQDPNGFLVERVRTFSSASYGTSQTDDHGGSHRLLEYCVDVEKATLSFLLDAHRVWRRDRNYSLHFRLAPTKAIIAVRQEDLDEKTVSAVVEWILEDMDKKKLRCELVVVEEYDDESDDDGSFRADDDDDDNDADEKETIPTLTSLMNNNGVGVPFFISIDKRVIDTGIVRVFQRETRWAEEIHIRFLVRKLAAYLNAI